MNNNQNFEQFNDLTLVIDQKERKEYLDYQYTLTYLLTT